MNSKNFKKKCEYCGNNPVPHFTNWYFESLNILLTPVRRVILYNPISKFVKNFFSKLKIFEKFLNFLYFFGLIKWQTDRAQCKIQRAKVLWEEAEKKGIKMRQLVLFTKPIDIYFAEKKQRKIVFSGLPRPENYDDSSLDWMDDKQILKSKFLHAGLPVPMGGSVWNFRQAKKIFEGIQNAKFRMQNDCKENSELSIRHTASSVIVKPRAGSRGRHSTTFVSSISDLKKAYKIAKQLCFWVVVEEQIMGPVYRATLINYELCGVLKGEAPQVIGDGVHNVLQLIEIKNKKLHPGVKDIIIDEGMERFIERQIQNVKCRMQNAEFQYPPFSSPPILGGEKRGRGLSEAHTYTIFDYIPDLGEVVQLSEKIGVNYGGSSSEDFEICHEDNKQLFLKAGKVVGDPIVGFDFIIPDIQKSWKEQKCGFIEANSLPFINLHHDPLHGTPRNVAKKVWEMMGFFN